MSIILMMSMSLSLLTLIIKHPLSVGMILLIQTMLMSIYSSMINNTAWYSFILFLVMIGGMMVLFIYMTSIASNEKFSMNMKFIFILPIPIVAMLNSSKFSSLLNMNSMMLNNKEMDLQTMFIKFWDMPMYYSIIFVFIYLLMTMIATVKITKSNYGPLRQMY